MESHPKYSDSRSRRSPSIYHRKEAARIEGRGRRSSADLKSRVDDGKYGFQKSRSRSTSPRRLGRWDEFEGSCRAPKCQRRHSPSPSPERRRRDPIEAYKYTRRRQTKSRSRSRSRSPYSRTRHRNDRSRQGWRGYESPPRSRDDCKHSRKRSSRSRSPRHRRDGSHHSLDRSRNGRNISQSPRRDHPKLYGRRHTSLSPPPKRSKAPLPSQQAAFSSETTVTRPDASPSTEKQKPNYAPTGLLAAETKKVTTGSTAIVLKYHEPPEARLPPSSAAWRLYIFKGKDLLETLELHTRSCWLFGRERAVVDVPVEHPSASKQHAVVQFRYVEKKNEWGVRKGEVKPYVIDLDSANGTKVNGEKVDGRRYVELRTGDVIGFGESSREYVVLLPPKG